MLQEIIEKLDLKETDKHFGVTKINNVTVYLFGDKIYCAACNTLGEPDNDKVMFFIEPNYTKITNKLLLMLPVEEIKRKFFTTSASADRLHPFCY